MNQNSSWESLTDAEKPMPEKRGSGFLNHLDWAFGLHPWSLPRRGGDQERPGGVQCTVGKDKSTSTASSNKKIIYSPAETPGVGEVAGDPGGEPLWRPSGNTLLLVEGTPYPD